jgi:hypothetical protein
MAVGVRAIGVARATTVAVARGGAGALGIAVRSVGRAEITASEISYGRLPEGFGRERSATTATSR